MDELLDNENSIDGQAERYRRTPEPRGDGGVNWRADLRKIVEVVPPDQVPDLIAELARLDVHARQRLAPDNGGAPPQPEKYLRAKDVALMLSVSTKWVYAHQRQLGGTRLDGALRFSANAVRRYLAAGRKA